MVSDETPVEWLVRVGAVQNDEDTGTTYLGGYVRKTIGLI